ncbi:hypothetical protein [Olivibacter sitiensis]|uniref:hypothetical protein n=1 Tax=Olivibacter sitiensis TaxID=376470 RepID=UPI0004211FE6|nr:hypothetical protein [Olivibacter sitiensis]
MSSIFILNIIRFFLLLAVQVFLFKNVGYYNVATAFPYILFLLLLPLNIPNWLLYTISLATGIVVDMFYDTFGVHAAACCTLAFVRIIVMKLTVDYEAHETLATPGIGEMNFRWFFFYSSVLVLTHHLTLFMVEAFTFSNLHYTLISAFLSSIFTEVVILLFSLIFYRKTKR